MARVSDDISIVYYSAKTIPEAFRKETFYQLGLSAGDIPIIEVYIEEGTKPSHVNIYKQALDGAKKAKTKYIALAEDDVLYSPEHFKYRPNDGVFAYNNNAWMIYIWQDEPIFSQKSGGRRNLSGLICERELFISAMTERFMNYPDWDKIDISVWAEPGKYERMLGVTVRETETFQTNPPNIIFSHEDELSFAGLGKRKRVGEIRATEIPYWGRAIDVRRYHV